MSAAGPLPEELLRLLAAIDEWLKARGVSTSEPAAAVRDVLARTARPQVAEHLADAAASLVLAFRALVETPVPTAEDPDQAGVEDEAPAPPIQHIAVN